MSITQVKYDGASVIQEVYVAGVPVIAYTYSAGRILSGPRNSAATQAIAEFAETVSQLETFLNAIERHSKVVLPIPRDLPLYLIAKRAHVRREPARRMEPRAVHVHLLLGQLDSEWTYDPGIGSVTFQPRPAYDIALAEWLILIRILRTCAWWAEAALDALPTTPLAVPVPEEPGAYRCIDANGTVVCKAGAGALRRIVINAAGNNSTATVYDNTAGTGTRIATLDCSVTGAREYGVAFSVGLTVVLSGGLPGDITVVFE